MKSKMKKITACIVVAAMVFTLGNQSIFTVFAEEDDPVDAVYEIETDEGTDESAATEEAAAEMASEETAAEETAPEEPGTVDAESSAEAESVVPDASEMDFDTAEAEAVVPDAPETDADTAEEDLLDEKDEEEIVFLDEVVPVAAGDFALYVSSAAANLTASGTEPFDDDDDDGNDSSAENDVIRSFDQAEYSLNINMKSEDEEATYDNVRIWTEITLTGSDIENAFNEEKIGLDYYNIVDNGESRTLTGYIDDLGTAVAPGELNNVIFGVQVLAMDDGTVLQPTGTVWLEELDEDGQSTGVTSESHELTFSALTVSARLHLNVYLTQNNTANRSEGTYDFTTSDSGYLNYDKGKVEGRLYGYSMILQMYDEAGNKGLKGQALPSGEDFEVSVKIASTYKVDSTASTSYAGTTQNLDTFDSGNYRALFYSGGANVTDNPKSDGRSLTSEEGYKPNTLRAYNSPGSTASASQLGDNCVENSGTWSAVSQSLDEDGTTVTFTISGYEITKLLFPYRNYSSAVTTRNYYEEDTALWDIQQACWSVGEMWLVQPYSYTDETGTLHELRNEVGTGSFTITAKADTEVVASYNSYDEDGKKEVRESSAQVYSGDDSVSATIALDLDASYSVRMNFTDTINGDHNAQGLGSSYYGYSYATLGFDDIRLRGRQTYTAGSASNRMAAYNTVLKFDADAIELDNSSSPYTKSSYVNNVFYGYRPDGTNWISEDEMQAADEDDLVWYSSVQTDKECVALLFEARTPVDTFEVQYFDNYALIHVKKDAELAGNVYMGCIVMRLWIATDIATAYNAKVAAGEIDGDLITASMLTKADGKQYVDQVLPSAANDYYTSETNGILTQNHSTADLLSQSFGYGSGGSYNTPNAGSKYVKTVYNADGTITRTSSNYGDSLYVMGYEANIEKNIAQQTEEYDENGNATGGTTTKTNYRFARMERTADYQIDAVMNMDDEVELKDDSGDALATTVTITDTLPAGETYLTDSSYFGLVDPATGEFAITYTQSTPLGLQGTVSGGILVEEVATADGLTDTSKSAALYVEKNSDGTETLTYVIRNVPVVPGSAARIYYSTNLGDETSDERDLKNGDRLTNTASIQSTEDIYRTIESTYGNEASSTITVLKTGSNTFTKYAVDTYEEVGGDPTWVISVVNSGAAESEIMLLDDMPVSGGNYGSSFTGSYTISDWFVERGTLTDTDLETLTLYYTTDPTYADESLVLQHQEGAITWEEITGGWSTVPITIDADGAHADFSDVGGFVYAWALGGTLQQNESIAVTVSVHQDDPNGGDVLFNTAWEATSEDTFHRSAPVYRVTRTISGTVWLDEDLDGGIDTGTYQNETKISGVKVTLQLYDEEKESWSDVQETTTDGSGEYEFTNLLDGTYRIVFSDDTNTYRLSEHSVTSYEKAGIDGFANSKVKTEDGEHVIDEIALPDIDHMTTYIYNLDYQNAGFTKTQEWNVEKQWVDFLGEDITESVTDSVDFEMSIATAVNGEDITRSFTLGPSMWTTTVSDIPYYDGSGQELEIKEENFTFTEDEETLPDGYHMEYTVANNTVSVVNALEQEPIEITVTKEWDDADNQDGKRPGSVTVYLYAGEEQVDSATLAPITPLAQPLTGTAEEDWSYTFTGHDQYDNDTKEKITYTVVEDTDSLPEGYTVSYEPEGGVVGDNNAVTITNTHVPETISIEANKIWEDADNQDGKRPDNVTVHLYADGTEVEAAEMEPAHIGVWARLIHPFASINASEEWTYTFDDLPKYANGQEIIYTLTEEEVTDYTSKVGELTLKEGETDVYEVEITNTHEPETISLTLVKEWEDADNQDGIRPDSVALQLTGTDSSSQDVTLSATEGWRTTVNDLPKYAVGKEGELVTYAVTENAITLPDGHDGEEGYTTTYAPETGVTGEDGTITITNSHIPATVDVSGTKTWEDNSNQDGKRPKSITVNLLADNEKVDSAEVIESSADAEGNWTYSFTDLPKYKSGTKITYTVTEDAVSEYTTAYDGYTITNSYTPEMTTATITIDWQDDNNRDGLRPTGDVTLTLTGSDGTIYTVTLNEANNWSATVNVPVYYNNGTKITYSVSQTPLDGYTGAIDDGGGYNFTITNTHVPAMIDGDTGTVTVKKVWEDANAQDGIRPEEVTVTVTGSTDSEPTAYTESVTLNGGNSWQDTLTGLYVYDAGEEITYTAKESEFVITETRDTYYETTYTGGADAAYEYTFTVMNSHTPDTTSVDVQKVWNDDGNRDAM